MKKTMDLTRLENIDLSQAIAYASPMDTPFITLLLQNGLVENANSTKITWREATLDANRKGPKLEGADATNIGKTVRREIENNQQIFERTAEVSGSLDAIQVKGVAGGELAQSINDRMIENKIDLEWYAIQGTKADEAGETPRQMNGIINLINSANKFSVANAEGRISADDLIKAFRLPWEKGAGGDKIIMCGATVKEYLNTLLKVDKGVSIPVLQGGGNIIGITADRVHTDYGSGNIILNRHIPAETIIIYDLQNCKLRPLRAMKAEQLAKNGDSSKYMIIGEYSLQFNNTYAGSVITGIKGYVEPVATTPQTLQA
ncbi:hypothetical protein CLPU_3c00860 [Gottschalkia purinilytica]|uniref:Phage major capsid protein, HK97 family n=1 Tax=Gottschalkia purinilytica TaxID=1503 RepID=A0A0L0WCW6_GOTPU|nr:DUF5309 family protein [Gottschalkia purinilytica]KNF09308.1 hypothetical protein CLPU_3c00860 [Gottschalkia purinilytica]